MNPARMKQNRTRLSTAKSLLKQVRRKYDTGTLVYARCTDAIKEVDRCIISVDNQIDRLTGGNHSARV